MCGWGEVSACMLALLGVVLLWPWMCVCMCMVVVWVEEGMGQLGDEEEGRKSPFTKMAR